MEIKNPYNRLDAITKFKIGSHPFAQGLAPEDFWSVLQQIIDLKAAVIAFGVVGTLTFLQFLFLRNLGNKRPDNVGSKIKR